MNRSAALRLLLRLLLILCAALVVTGCSADRARDDRPRPVGPGGKVVRSAPWLGSGDGIVYRHSFGMCSGLCDLGININSDGAVQFASFDRASAVMASTHGTLTEQGRSVVGPVALAFGAEDIHIDASYGCVDCADGGGTHVEIRVGERTILTAFGYGEPPATLASLDDVADAVLRSMESCRSSPLVTVEDCARGGG